MKVYELIARLHRFNPEHEVFIFDGDPECITINRVTDGEFDRGIWVDTACDGIYTGYETRCCQLAIGVATE